MSTVDGLGKWYEPCSTCWGYGIVSTPEWIAWRLAFSEAEKAEGTSIMVAGYSRWQDNYISEHPYPTVGEEEGCGECDGTGRSLTPEGSELVGFLMKVGFVKEYQLKQAIREAVQA